jgi:hypothetical protein
MIRIRKLVLATGCLALILGSAAIATPAVASPAQTTAGVFRNPAWNGHVLDTHGANPPADITQVTATWTVPAIACTFGDAVAGSAASYWTGLGGLAGESLAQTGIETDCDLGIHGPNQENYAWWEIANNIPEVQLSTTTHPVKVNDTITATVDYTGGGTAPDYTFTLDDPTQGWTWSTSCPGNPACPSSGVPAGYPQYDAVVIEPRFNGLGVQSPLADFGTVSFTDVTYEDVNNSGGYTVLAFEAPQTGKPEAIPSSSLLNWTVTWKNSGLHHGHGR